MFRKEGCRSLLSIGGDNLQVYPNFALFSTLGRMNLDHDFVQVSKLSEDQKKVFIKNGAFFPQIQVKTTKKKGFHQKGNTFFPEFKWTPTLRCTPESNYWGGCRCRPYSNYWGGDISPHPPRVSAPPLGRRSKKASW